MERALLDRLVEGGHGLAIGLLGGGFVALGDGLAQVAELGAQAGSVGAVARGTLGSGGRASPLKDDLPCLVRYLRKSREIFGWVRITYYRGAVLEAVKLTPTSKGLYQRGPQRSSKSAMPDGLERLKVLIDSSTPIVAMETVEEVRAVRMVRAACSALNLAAFEWSIASGLMRCGSSVGEIVTGHEAGIGAAGGYVPTETIEQNAKALYNSREPAQMLSNLEGISIEAAFILKDLHRHMDDPVVVRRLRDVGQRFATNRKTIVLTAPKLEIPPELRSLVEFFELPLPDRQRLRQIIDETLVRVGKTRTLQRKLDANGLDAIAENLRGLTEEEAERASFAGAGNEICADSGGCDGCSPDKESFVEAFGDAGICGIFRYHGRSWWPGKSEAVAGATPRSVGRLGARVWPGASTWRDYSGCAGMRKVPVRTGGGRGVEPAAGEIRYLGGLRQIYWRDGEAHPQSVPGGGRPCALRAVD